MHLKTQAELRGESSEVFPKLWTSADLRAVVHSLGCSALDLSLSSSVSHSNLVSDSSSPQLLYHTNQGTPRTNHVTTHSHRAYQSTIQGTYPLHWHTLSYTHTHTEKHIYTSQSHIHHADHQSGSDEPGHGVGCTSPSQERYRDGRVFGLNSDSCSGTSASIRSHLHEKMQTQQFQAP